MLNFRAIRDRLVWVSILVRKRLDFRHVLEVHFGHKGFGYLDIRERPINLYFSFGKRPINLYSVL